MLASKRSLRLSRRSAFLVGSSSVAVAVAVGCGGGSDTSTGSFGGSGGATSTTKTTTGEGGTLFMFASSSSSSGAGGSTGGTGGTTGSTTTGPVCDGNPTTGPGKWAVKNADDNNTQFGLGVAADPFGNVYVTGGYRGTITIGGKTGDKQGATSNAMFVAKLDSNGVAQWVHGYDSTPISGGTVTPAFAGRAIVADAQGNSYVLGEVAGLTTIVAPSTPGAPALRSTGGHFGDSFLIKYNTSGAISWVTRIGETPNGMSNGPFGTQTTYSVALRKAATGDEVLIGGSSQGKLDFDNGTSLTANSTATSAAFIAVFRSGDGSAKLALALGDGLTDQAVRGVAWDSNGDILVTGDAQGPVNFPGGTTLMPVGTKATFVAKLKGDGTGTTWAKLYGSKEAVGKAIAVDGTGNVFVAGDHKGDIDFGGGVLANNFGSNVFLAKLDPSGNHVWSHTYGDSVAQNVQGMRVDAMGRAVLAGDYRGQIDFGGGALTAGDQDGFVAKLDTHGCQVWAKTIGDPKVQGANGVALDAMGNVVITGSLNGSATFGSTTLTVPSADGGGDLFVAQFGP